MTDEQVRPFVNDIVERLLNTDRGYDLIGRDCADAADEIVGLRSACSAYRARLATAENELVAQEAEARKLVEALDIIEEGFRKPFDHLDGCLFKADPKMPCQCDPRARMERFRAKALSFLDITRAALAEGRGK